MSFDIIKKEDLDFNKDVECRGRNGWFRFGEMCIINYDEVDQITIDIYSNKKGEFSPIALIGSKKDIRKLVTQLFLKVIMKI